MPTDPSFIITLFSEWGFLLPPLCGALILAAISGPLGCLVIWQRMAFFGDTLAHSALLGVAVSLMFHLSPLVGMGIITLLVATLLANLYYERLMSTDTLLGLVAHGAMAMALLLWSLNPGQMNLVGYLVGDILTIGWKHVGGIALVGLIALAILICRWPELLLMTMNRSLAVAEGVAVRRMQWMLMCLLAIVIACAIQLVGALLTTALLLLPASIARLYARTPVQMALFASLVGIFGAMGGMTWSAMQDVPTGPAMIVTLLGSLLLSAVLRQIRRAA